ncbi:serine hydrolase domain-containing protein [Marinicella sediminis]|uniref:Serine hydrolase domain-containing protein n=1 Tax=Marinicella sediminis TaxID=1792834 RepID=A0ABV7JHW6_9GAMM|nr:serine hydrolase domain-containing protein [Marinicella sediminis]
MMKKMLLLLLLSFSTVDGFEWPEQTPEAAGLDAAYLNAAIAQIQSGEVGQIRSLIIIRDGQLVTERYFNNSGEKRPVFSVTKSIGSALLGIAAYQGAEINPAASILDYLPQYDNVPNRAQVSQITLHDLLNQRHGYRWDEWSTPFTDPANPVYQMMGTFDWYRTATQWSVLTTPDQLFAYSSGHSSLMSPILQNRTGRDVYEFAQAELFDPLDITDTDWNVFDPRNPSQGITDFPWGLQPMGFGLWMKPIDLAKVGELYRLNGVWQGERLLGEEWISQSVVRYSDGNSDPAVFSSEYAGYGYQWWITRLTDDRGRPFDMYYANGFGRQYIFVIPQINTVIVSTAADYNTSSTTPGMGTVLRENLLLAFGTDELPPFPMSSDLNGSWYDPATNGQGINIEILNEGQTFLGYWYTFDATGDHQRWFTLQGEVVNDVASFQIISTTGGVFVDPATVELSVWGSGTMSATDCLSATFTFSSEVESVAGEIPLSRLTGSTGGCVNSNQQAQPGPRLY